MTGDLVPSSDRRSAEFTAHAIGSADIKATSGSLTPQPSGVITATPGTPTIVRVETASNGSGTVVPAESLASGSSITAYAITRDPSNNFVANVAATVWGLQNITGGVVASDLVAAPDNRSAVFTGHATGSASIVATSGSLAQIPSGTITVFPHTGVAEGSQPLTYALMQNYPNPFNPSTQIDFDVPFAGQVSLVVYDIVGREIAVLANGQLEPGHHSATWNAAQQASGVYFAKFIAADKQGNVKYTKVNKLMLMK